MRPVSNSSLDSRGGTRRLRAVTRVATIALFLLAACGGGAAAPESERPPVPADAIQIGEDLYMVPLAAPVDDCPAYRAFSPTKRVAQVIYFRAADGSFTADRSKADCR